MLRKSLEAVNHQQNPSVRNGRAQIIDNDKLGRAKAEIEKKQHAASAWAETINIGW